MKRVWKKSQIVSGQGMSFRKWSDYSVGDIVIGEFIGDYMDTKYGKRCRMLKVYETIFKDKNANLAEGKTLVLNHTGKSDKAFDRIEKGAIVQVTYNGLEMMDGGKFEGKEAHQIEVAVMEEGDDTQSESQDEDFDFGPDDYEDDAVNGL